MAITKARRTRNCNRLKSNGKSVEIIGFCGISTSYPLHLPLMIVASIKFGNSFLTASLVLLHNFEGSELRMSINDEPNFKDMMCGGITDGFKELKTLLDSGSLFLIYNCVY